MKKTKKIKGYGVLVDFQEGKEPILDFVNLDIEEAQKFRRGTWSPKISKVVPVTITFQTND